MFGIAFVVVGIIILLQALGYLGSIPAGIVWGISFIVIGISFLIRRAHRRERRAEWRARRQAQQEGSSEK